LLPALRAAIVLLTFALPITACGIRFLDPDPETELFEDIEITGSRTPGSDLTINLTLTQAYPIAVQIGCYYEIAGKELSDFEEELAFHERALQVAEATLPASATTSPDDEVDERELQFHFSVPEPGRYFLACLTPASPENGIGMIFTIRRP
jgi:hypothetical protein